MNKKEFHFEKIDNINYLNTVKEYELVKQLDKVADIAIKRCAKVKSGEKVLILGDTGSDERVMDLFQYKCKEVGAEALKMSFHFVESVLQIPERVSHAMWECDVLFPFTKSQILYSDAIAGTLKKGRILYMSDLETHNMLRPVILEADFEEMSQIGPIIKSIIQNAKKLQVKTKAGTDAIMYMDSNRPARCTDSVADKAGELDYLPGGSWSAAPIEESVNGTFVVDVSLYPVGLLDEPVIFTYENGWIKNIEGGKQAKKMKDWLKYRQEINNGDKMHYFFSHIGGGLNKKASATGNLMEDERIWNAFCISGGSNQMTFKGKNNAHSHWDGMCRDCTLIVDGVQVIEDGKFVHPQLARFEK